MTPQKRGRGVFRGDTSHSWVLTVDCSAVRLGHNPTKGGSVMGDYGRGIVKRITFEIEYPDGSRKTSTIEGAETVRLISFDDDQSPELNVSTDDWTQNPAMIVLSKVEGKHIPFCTHNGCKNLTIG